MESEEDTDSAVEEADEDDPVEANEKDTGGKSGFLDSLPPR